MAAFLSDIHRRRDALIALLMVTPPCALVYLVLNVQREQLVLVALNGLLVAACGGLLIALRRGLQAQRASLIYVTLLFANLTWALLWPDVYSEMSTWLPLFPVASYLLLDRQLGLPVAGVWLLAAVTAYFVGAQSVAAPIDLMVVGNVVTPPVVLLIVCHAYTHSRAAADERMLQRALSDPLTGLGNRQMLVQEVERERQRARRSGMPLALILIDIDNFKGVNDRYGHDAGDAALAFVADLLRARVRRTDLACRLGGEEFVVLLPDTDAAGAARLAEDLRGALEAARFRYGDDEIRLTLSAGVAELGRDGSVWSELYRAADTRLYLAKESGRNRVVRDTSRSGE